MDGEAEKRARKGANNRVSGLSFASQVLSGWDSWF